MTPWVARAGRHRENENCALANHVEVEGWDDLSDLSSFPSRDALQASMQDTYPDKNPNASKNWESQLWAFSKRLQIGDIVSLPPKAQSAVAFGRIAGPYRYQTDAPLTARYQRPVDWLATDIPRSSIDSDLRFSLGGAMTVFEVKRNNAESRIRAMLKGEVAPSPATPVAPDNDGTNSREIETDLATQATDQIVDFTGRKFRGHGLAHLVASVLRAQGYTDVRDAGPGADGGVDIVAGRGPMGFDSPRLCVQVKSGDGRSTYRCSGNSKGS